MPLTIEQGEFSELATVFASLVLYDGQAEISADNINKVLAAANVKGVEAYWPKLWANFIKGADVAEILKNAASSGGGGGGGAAPAAEEKKEAGKAAEPEEEEEEETAAGAAGGFDLFGGGGDDGGY